MSNKPQVSVVTIFLNGEKFIHEAVESVFAQTFNNWELLLVDDGSTDASTQIALRYAKQNPANILYLEHAGHKNRGQSASRNLGIRSAKGEYIAFLDVDDIWLPYKLEKQIYILQRHPEAGMVYGPAYIFHDNTNERNKDRVQDTGGVNEGLIYPPELFVKFIVDFNITPCPSSTLIRSQVLSEIGGCDESACDALEDQCLWAKITLRYPVYFHNEVLFNYRRHNAAFGVQTLKRFSKYKLEFAKWLYGYLKTQEKTTTNQVSSLAKEQLYQAILDERKKQKG